MSIVQAGRTVESGTIADLRHLTRTSISAELAKPADTVAALPGVHDVAVDGGRLRCLVEGTELNALLRHLTTLGLKSLISQPPSLEELFMRHYRDETDGSAQRQVLR